MTAPEHNDVAAAQQELVAEFSLFENWIDRYQYIIDLGRRLPEFPRDAKTDSNKIKGCQSQVWFIAEEKDGLLHFQAISDAAIVSGLIALLLRIYSGRNPRQILETPADFIQQLQLDQHLSPTRSTGLAAMLTAIRTIAGDALTAA